MRKKLLSAAIMIASVWGSQLWAQTSPYTGTTVGAGTFYLYNVESGLWLQNNDSKANDWSTRAAIGTRGLDFEIAQSDDASAFYIGAKFGHPSINPNNNFIDTSNNPAWTFKSVTKDGVTNAYNISCGDKVLGTVYYNEANPQNNLFTQTGDNRWYLENPDYNINMTERNTWQIVTRAERLEKMQAAASTETPQDASWLIPSADFANNDTRYNLWTRSLNGGNGRTADGNGINGSMCIESWNSSSIDFSIIISDIPNGTYRMNVQGYYRDGNFTNVMSRRNAGTETIRSYYYAGDVKHPLMSILDEAKDAKVDGAYDRENNGKWYPDSQNSANKCFNLHKGYVNEEIEVVVTTNSLKLGIMKEEGIADDWTVFDNFKLTYLGNNIDISQFIDALQAAIDNAEAFDASLTTTALAKALSDAIAAGKAMLTSTDEAEISAATLAITSALEQAKAADVTLLRKTYELAEAEGVDMSDADYALTYATSSDEVNSALEDLRTARKINALRMPDIYTGTAPAVGKFYLYNIGTGMFLGSGSDWNTHAAVDQVGIEIEFVESGDGFILKSNYGSFNPSPYVDTNDNTVYTFEAVDGLDNVYNILQGSDLLGWNPQGKTDGKKYWSSISNVGGVSPDDANYQWKLISQAERKALLAKASSSNPVDVSYLINNPSLIRKAGYGMYTKSGPGGTVERVSTATDGNSDRAADYGYEFWNTNSTEFSQQLTGLTPGIYEVAVQAFYRESGGDTQAAKVNNGEELVSNAYLKANEETVELENIAFYLDGVPGIGSRATDYGNFPNWPAEALEYFQTGYYWNRVLVNVGTDGLLKIGVYKDTKVDSDWIVLDNFRLTFYGTTVTIGEALYATYVAPFDVDFSGSKVSAFAAQTQPTYVHLEPVTSVPAGTAVVVKADAAGTYSVDGTTDASLGVDNDLVAATEAVTASGTQYVLAQVDGNVGFNLATTGSAIPAGKGYLVILGGNVKGFYGFDPDDATAIANVSLDADADAPVYNIAGQRLQKVQKGINIVGGKKVLK